MLLEQCWSEEIFFRAILKALWAVLEAGFLEGESKDKTKYKLRMSMLLILF